MRTFTGAIIFALVSTVLADKICDTKNPSPTFKVGLDVLATCVRNADTPALVKCSLKCLMGRDACDQCKVDEHEQRTEEQKKTALILIKTNENACRKVLEILCKMKGGQTQKVINDMARNTLTKCLELVTEPADATDAQKTKALADKGKCRSAFALLTGIKDKVTEKLEELKGALDAVATEMKACVDAPQKCKDKVKKNMEKLTGKSITTDELRVMLEKAGRTEAAMAIKDCIKQATDKKTAQKSCFLNDAAVAAKNAFVKASGKAYDKITNSDLHKAVKDLARKDTFASFSACLQVAEDNTAKMACFKSDDLKTTIADAEGGAATDVSDSQVREYLEKEGKLEQLALVGSCVKGSGGDCKTLLKELKAKLTGLLPADISDFDIRKDIRDALPEQVQERMEACMEEAAGSDKKVKKCHSIIRGVIETADLDGKAADAAKVLRVLKEGAEKAMKSVMDNCDKTRAECMAEALAKSAMSMGQTVISKGRAEMLNRKAAVTAAKEAIQACVAAKKTDPAAVCDDAFAKYLETRQQDDPTNPASHKTLKASVLVAAQVMLVKDAIKVCLEEETTVAAAAATFMTCMEGAKADIAAVATDMFGDIRGGMKKAAKQGQAMREAVVEYLGELYESCMEAADPQAAESTESVCTTKMAEAKTKMAELKVGFSNSAKAIMQQFNADKIKEGILACFAPDKTQCLKDAKDEFRKLNKARKFLQEKKMAEIKAAADACAACFQEGLEDAACDEQAKQAFMDVSGTNGARFTEHLLPRVKKLCIAFAAGFEMVVKNIPQLSVEVQTDGTACDGSMQTQITAKVGAVQTTIAFSGVIEGGCRQEGDTVSYNTLASTANMDEAQADTAADTVATTFETTTLTRRLSVRRLDSITEVGVAADTELCSASDSTCGGGDFSAGNTVVEQPKPCDKRPLLDAFDVCVKLSNNNRFALTVCKTVLDSALEQHCGLKPSKEATAKLLNDLARAALTECLLQSQNEGDKAKCRKVFETVTGIKDKVMGKLEELRGALDSVADKMKSCAGDVQTCKETVKQNLEKLTGKTISTDKLRAMLEDAGRKEAATKIKDCISAATDANTQKTCFLGEKAAEAKRAFAAASGKLVEKVTVSDLYRAVKDAALKDTFDTFTACIQGAADDAAKKACFKSDDLKRAIANSEGGSATLIAASKVREYLAKQGRSEQLALVSDCVKGGEDCKTALKELKAKLTGKLPSQITDFDIKKDIMEALPEQVSERMQACIEEASGDATKEGECISIVKDIIKESDLEGKVPEVAKVLRVMKEGAVSAMESAMQNCDKTRAECMVEALSKSAAALGKKVISKGKAEMLNKKAAVKAAKDAIQACVAAKEETPDASCDDAFAQYLETRGQSAGANPQKEKILKAGVLVAAQAVAVKDAMKVCFESADDFKTCMESAKADLTAQATAVFNAAAKIAKEKQAERQAEVDYLGEQRDSCLEAAGADATQLAECDKQMVQAATKVGSKIQAWAIIQEFNADKIKEGILACMAEDKTQCLADAKEEFKKLNKARKFWQEKKIGEIKAAADACAACLQEGVADAACDAEAKEAYLAVSGADGAKWAENVLPKVQKLCTAIKDGLEVIMKKMKQLSVDTQTDGTSCQVSVQRKLVASILAVKTTVAFSDVVDGGCRGQRTSVLYTTKVKIANMDDAEVNADAVEEELKSAPLTRRLSARRLESITEVGSAVDTELCSASDATCGQTAFTANSETHQEAGGVALTINSKGGMFSSYAKSKGISDPSKVTVEMMALREIDADGTTALTEHSIESFASQSFTFSTPENVQMGKDSAVSAVKLNFKSDTVGGSIGVDTYIMTSAGTVGPEGEPWAVKAGDVKFNIELSKWNFCNSKDCAGTGEFVDLEIKIKGASEVAVMAAGVANSYVLGGGVGLQLTNKVMVDGKQVQMPTGYPRRVGSSQVFLFRFPKFTTSVLYDPLITASAGEGVVASPAAGRTGSLLSLVFAVLLSALAACA